MLFVLKLIKNGVTELLEGPAVAAGETHPATDRPRSGRSGSPNRATSAGGRSRPRSVSRGRAPPPAAAAAVVEVSNGGEEGDKEEKKKEEGKKEEAEEEEMDDETLEEAVRDLRSCMELVMKRLDIGTAMKKPALPPSALLCSHGHS